MNTHQHAVTARRRERVLTIVRASASPMAIGDVRREYHRLYGGSISDPGRDLAELEAAGKLERYNAEHGKGFVWLPAR